MEKILFYAACVQPGIISEELLFLSLESTLGKKTFNKELMQFSEISVHNGVIMSVSKQRLVRHVGILKLDFQQKLKLMELEIYTFFIMYDTMKATIKIKFLKYHQTHEKILQKFL